MVTERTSRRREIGKRLQEAAQYYLEHANESGVDKKGVAYMFDVKLNSLYPAIHYQRDPDARKLRVPYFKREGGGARPPRKKAFAYPPAPAPAPVAEPPVAYFDEGLAIGILCPGVSISVSEGEARINGVTLTARVMEALIASWHVMN